MHLALMQTKTIKASELEPGMFIALGVYGPESKILSVRTVGAGFTVAIETDDRDYTIYLRTHAKCEVRS